MTCDFLSLANPGVQKASPYQAGKAIETLMREYQLPHVIKLASNENPLGPSPKAVEAMRKAIEGVHLYPESGNHRLRHALAEFNQIDPTQIILANGSDSLIRLLNYAFVSARDEVLVPEHSFANFTLMANALGAQVVKSKSLNWGTDLTETAKEITPKTKLICIANPNNPTGTWFSHADFLAFMKQVPDNILVLLDEAYYEFMQNNPNYPDGLSLQQQFPNLIISRTFSKVYGLAGMRVGYFVANPAICALLHRIRLPFAVANLANEAALSALHDQPHIDATLKNNRESLALLETGLKKLAITFVPSAANFVFVDFKQAATPIYEALLKKGIIIRPLFANYQLTQQARISVGRCEETQAVLKALADILHP